MPTATPAMPTATPAMPMPMQAKRDIMALRGGRGWLSRARKGIADPKHRTTDSIKQYNKLLQPDAGNNHMTALKARLYEGKEVFRGRGG
eukprot:62617-Chlamydomonas_euryale.AAC.1